MNRDDKSNNSRTPRKQYGSRKRDNEPEDKPRPKSPQPPYVLQKMKIRSYMGDECRNGIMNVVEKMTNVDREVAYADKKKIIKLEDKVQSLDGDIYTYQ